MGWINNAQFERDHNGQRDTCAACGHDGTQARPLVLDDEGCRVHRDHTDDPASGMYGHRQAADDRNDADEA
jgi:hypothetical protein